MKKGKEEKISVEKRDFLKKAAVTAFSIPVMQTFKVDELHAAPHSNPGWGDGAGGGANKGPAK